MHSVAEGRVCSEMLELYQVDGIISEPAGALASAALDQLGPLAGSRVVCVLSGGNNDVSRYPEIVERSLVFEGLKHYFLIGFPQEPGALRRFLDHALGPDDDITLFEYVKRSNRETGPGARRHRTRAPHRPRTAAHPARRAPAQRRAHHSRAGRVPLPGLVPEVDPQQAADIIEIQQLAVGYVVGIDRRDVDMIAALFVPDVDCGHWGTGPEAFKRMYLENDSTFGVSIHQATNHLVTIESAERASGICYLTAEQQQHDGSWARLAGAYEDRYERVGGRWLFKARKLLFWYREAAAPDRPARPHVPHLLEVADPAGRLAHLGEVLGRRP